MRALLVALLLTLGVANAAAADKYIDSDITLGSSYQNIFRWSVASGKIYKFSILVILDGDSPIVPMRFGGTATPERLAAGNGISNFGQVTTNITRLEGTLKVGSGGSFVLQAKTANGPALIAAGSIMSLSEVTP